MELHLTQTGTMFLLPDNAEPAKAFAVSREKGLFELAVHPQPDNAGPLLCFFRDTVRDYLQGLLREGTDMGNAGQIPNAETCRLLAEKMPSPAQGERPAADFFSELLQSVYSFVKKESESSGKTLREWLTEHIPEWKNIGIVTFHLAENLKDPDGRHPFLFLATYPDKTGADGKPRHIPLSSALKLYAGQPQTLLSLLQPIREASKESPFLTGLLADQSIYRPCLWTPHQAFLFVRDIDCFQHAGILVRLNKETGKRPARLKVQITLDAAASGKKGIPLTETLLRFSVSAAAGAHELTKEELEAIAHSGTGLIRIKGEWIEADTERVRELLHQWEIAKAISDNADIPFLAGLRFLSGMRRKNVQDGLPPAPDDICEVKAGPNLSRLLEQELHSTLLPPFPETCPLRPYQQDGTAWLYRMGEFGLGGCLADDMGLGKTLQVLAFLEMLRRQGSLTKISALAIVPASLLGTWKSESEKFTPELKTKLLHPSEDTVSSFRNDPKSFLETYDLVVTSYTMAVRLCDILNQFTFPVILLDEAQNIKNAQCGQSQAVHSLKGIRRFALTGTPVENSPADLWSIFDFLVPGLLGPLQPFLESVRQMGQSKSGYAPLRKLVRPCILRRLKTDKRIIRDLPDKTEVREWCILSKPQLQIYQRAVNEMKKELEQSEEERRSGIILSFLTQFKQICNHPTQFTGLGEYTIERSGKFRRLAELAEQFAQRGDRLLVFTQFKEIIEPIRIMLAGIYGRNGLILHGGIPPAERTRSVELFQREDGPPFFVLSLRAAGTGLTLTAANQVVHFDRWWNPAVENQATDRAFRIGQKRNVLVHKFVCRGTLEEKIDAIISGKSRLAGDILSNGPEKLLTAMSDHELMDFVRIDAAAFADAE